jgi:hypothetical protein
MRERRAHTQAHTRTTVQQQRISIAYFAAVDEIAVLLECQAADDNALLGRHNWTAQAARVRRAASGQQTGSPRSARAVQAGARAAEHAAHVVENSVRTLLILRGVTSRREQGALAPPPPLRRRRHRRRRRHTSKSLTSV